MIEIIIRLYLQAALDVPVMTAHRTDDPESFVIIERIGGGMTNRVREASVALQSYGPTSVWPEASTYSQVGLPSSPTIILVAHPRPL